jgi:uncharacterized protein involved in response to NO
LVKLRVTRLPASLGWFDRLTLGLVPAALAAWVVGVEQPASAALLLAAGLACGLRLARWRGIAIWRDPLISALHLGHAWLALGLILLGLSGVLAAVPPVAAMHALGAGAVGTMILAVMIRSTLAHTGRAQLGGTWTVAISLLGHVAALLRVAAAFLPGAYSALLPASGAAWIMAFSLFAVIYGPCLLRSTSTTASTN